jgi:hypothetical protein
MRTSHRYIALATLSAVLASLIAYAGGQEQQQRDAIVERHSGDLLPDARDRRLALTASTVGMESAAMASGPTIEEVGDVDSFGRNVKWLGVTQMNVQLVDTCAPDALPGCVELNPAPASTSFAFEDLARIELPKKAANSLLCYWLSPYLFTSYANPTAGPVTARLTFFPTLTVENPVLDDPALIDPTTGLPFGGALRTGMTSSELFEVLLDPGQQLTERTRDSAVCIAGFLSKRSLVDNFGLTDAQAKEFFKQPTTVRMNISGTAQYVQFANLIFGFRIVGD